MKKILFLIPHPDDEIVGACKIIKKLLDKKKKFLFFFLPMESLIRAQCGFGKEEIMTII